MYMYVSILKSVLFKFSIVSRITGLLGLYLAKELPICMSIMSFANAIGNSYFGSLHKTKLQDSI